MADRFFVNGGVDSNWGTSGNWSLTDGGAGGASVPTGSDHVKLTVNSPASLVVNASDRACQGLTTTGWTGTIAMTFGITVGAATMTLAAGTAFSGTGLLVLASGSTQTSAGVFIPRLRFFGNVIFTLADDFFCGDLLLGSGNNGTTINGFTISVSGNLDRSLMSTGFVGGTTEIILTGTGTIFHPSSTGDVRNPITINTAGTITFDSGTFRYHTSTLKYTAGSVVATACDILLPNGVAVATLDCGGDSGIVFRDLLCQLGTQTLTLSSDMTISRDYVHGVSTTQTTTINGHTLRIGRNLTMGSKTSGIIAGTTVFEIYHGGTISAASQTTAGMFSSPLVIDAPGEVVTVSGAFRLNDLGNLVVRNGQVTTTETWPQSAGIGGGVTNVAYW